MTIRLTGFLALWLVMMAAMMAPSVYPTVRLFLVARESRFAFGVRPAPAWTFVAGYLAAWCLVGLPAYAILSAVPMGVFGPRLPGGPRIGRALGVLLVVAGAAVTLRFGA